MEIIQIYTLTLVCLFVVAYLITYFIYGYKGRDQNETKIKMSNTDMGWK